MRISDWSSDVCSSDLNAVLDVMFAPDFLPHVERSGKLLRRKLEDLAARFPHVLAEVRGTGLMLGLKCVVTNTDLVARLREEGLLTVGAAENVVRLLTPPKLGSASCWERACQYVL